MDKYEQRRVTLKKLADHLGRGGITQIAEKIGKQASYVSRMLYPAEKAGFKRIGEDTVDELNSAFPGWFSNSGEIPYTQTVKWVDSVGEPIKEWNNEADLNPEEFTIIPRYDITVSAGNGHTVSEEVQKNKGQAYRADWLKAMGLKGHELKSIRAKGDSMMPTFGDGCALLVDFSHKDIIEGKVYIIRFGDEIRVKRIHKRPDGGVIIRSDNRDAYPDINIPPEEMKNIEVLGRVRHYSGDL